MEGSPSSETYLTVAEVAELLKLNQQTVRNWIDAGSLPAVRVGRRVRIRRSDFERVLEAGSTVAGPPTGPSAVDFWSGKPVGAAELDPDAPKQSSAVAAEFDPGAPEQSSAVAAELDPDAPEQSSAVAAASGPQIRARSTAVAAETDPDAPAPLSAAVAEPAGESNGPRAVAQSPDEPPERG